MTDTAQEIYIDPQIAEILREMAEADLPALSSLPIEAARAQVAQGNLVWNRDPPELPSVTDLTMPGPAGPMALRHYRPSDVALLPLVIYFHGGGWAVCSLDTHDRLMRLLALDSNAAVIGVDYRLAPEHPFPAPLDDCVAAVRWIRSQARSLGVDPDRIVLAGDSAGANLALASLLTLRDQGDPQVQGGALFYGCYWWRFDTPAHQQFGDGSWRLGTAEMRWFWRMYVGDGPPDNPLAEPINADLRGLPPLFLTAATLDPLYDDTLELDSRLGAAGAPHRLAVYPGLIHGFMQMSAPCEAARDAIVEAGQAIRQMLV
jgi:acetyl esterase